MKLSIFFFLIYLLIVPLSSDKTYFLEKLILEDSKEKLTGAFTLSEDRVLFIIYNEGAFIVDANGNFVASGDISSSDSFLVSSVLQLSEDQLVVYRGDQELYLANKSFKETKTLIKYSPEKHPRIAKSVLEIFDGKIIFGSYSPSDNGSKGFSFRLMSGKLDLENGYLSELESTGYEQSYANSKNNKDDYITSCKLFEEGSSIFCASVLENKTIALNIIHETPDQSENGEVTTISAEGVLVVKLNENRAAVVARNSSNTVVEFYSINEKVFSPMGNITLDFGASPETFGAARMNNETVYVADAKTNECVIHYVTLKYDLVLESNFRLADLLVNEIKITEFATSGLAILLREFGTDFVKFALFKSRECFDLEVKIMSFEIKTIGVLQLTDDYDSLLISDVIVEKGVAGVSETLDEIYYLGIQYGIDRIFYLLKDHKDDSISLYYCLVTVIICNQACSRCFEYSDDYFNTGCVLCADNYYHLEEDISKCFSRDTPPNRYFFDSDKQVFRSCYETCETCERKGNELQHLCTSCIIENFIPDEETGNCNCGGLIYTVGNETKCLDNCPREAPYVIKPLKKCVERCKSEEHPYQRVYFFECVDVCPKGTTDVNNVCFPTTPEQVIDNIDSYIIELYKYQNIFSVQKATFEIYDILEDSPSKIIPMKNVSQIDLGDVEKVIKSTLNIDNFLVFKGDFYLKDSAINQVEYSFFTTEGKRIDPSIYKNYKVTIHHPIDVSKTVDLELQETYKMKLLGYNKNDQNDKFYNDICSTYTTKYNTDVILDDRKKYIYKNITFCEENCSFKSLRVIENEIICECEAKETFKQEKRKFAYIQASKKFQKLLSHSNFRCFSCLKYLFTSKSLSVFTFWAIIIHFLAQLVIFLAMFSELSFQVAFVKTLIFQKISSQNSDQDSNSKRTFQHSEKSPERVKFLGKAEESNVENPEQVNLKASSEGSPRTNPLKQKDNLTIKKHQDSLASLKSVIKEEEEDSKKEAPLRCKEKKTLNLQQKIVLKSGLTRNKEKNQKSQKKVLESLEEDLNIIKVVDNDFQYMTLEEVLKKDKREILGIYYGFLKYKQSVIFTFITDGDYNLFAVKISLFLIQLNVFWLFNTFFFTDKYFSILFVSKGGYDLSYNFAKVIYSAIATCFVMNLLRLLALSQGTVHCINLVNIDSNTEKVENGLIRNLKLKAFLYFLTVLIIVVFSFLYLGTFSLIFENTQIILVVDSLISFTISLLYPFIFCIITAVLRFMSIKYKSKGLFLASKIFNYL